MYGVRRGALLFLASSVLACVAPPPPPGSHFRRATARANATIFSPLPWPTPSAERAASGAPGPGYWQQEADYRITAEFDPASRRLRGSELVTYTNHSPDALAYLWLNLDANVFRADSIGARVGERTAIAMREPSGDGMVLERVRVAGKDMVVSVYDTLARIPLPSPLEPRGGKIELEIAWELVVPERVFRRFGIDKVEQGEIFELAQWFPSLAVYDDVHGWNTLPYIGTGEFYTNFGDYDVRLTVPWDHLVVATGELQNPDEVYTAEQRERLARARSSEKTVIIRSVEEVGAEHSRPVTSGMLTWHFRASDVRTFAWASSPAFVLDAASADGVLCQSAYPREALPLWESSTQMVRTVVLGMGARWHRYPYPVATSVNGNEMGMEYPMIVFCSERSDERALYGLTAHEIGHTWFPMLVNTDERRHSWMDEGLNTFIEYYADEDWFGAPAEGRGNPASFAPRMLDPELLPIETPADRLPPHLFGELQYTKTAAGLILLREAVLGAERFDYAFRTYIRRWAFKSPRPADFFRTIEDAAGADLAWFWRGWFYETGWLDQAVAKVVQPEEGRPALVAFENRGELVMPLHYRVVFAGGEEEERVLPVEVWFHSDLVVERMPPGRRIEDLVIDPDGLMPDVDRSNDRWD